MGKHLLIPENSVMVDIETTGTDPQRHVMIQIGACVFNDKFEITSEFRRSLTAPPDRVDDQETLDWWASTNTPLYEKIRSAAEPYETVLEDLCNWMPRPRGLLFGWPANFDLNFVFQYARSYNRKLLHFFYPSRFVDCGSWAMGFRGTWLSVAEQTAIFNQPSPYGGVVHDGLDDAKSQVASLQRLCEEVRRRQAEAEAESLLEAFPENDKHQTRPIGVCPKCFTPVYTDVGFCGVCRLREGVW